MKTKEHYIEEYINYLYGEDKDELIYAPDVVHSKNDFKAGFNLAEELFKPKWISVEEQLPNNDRTVLVWINDTQNPQWSGYKLGAYLNQNWYCQGGRESHEVVTDWAKIPAKK